MGWDIFFKQLLVETDCHSAHKYMSKKHQKDKNIYKQRENVFFGPVLI